MKKNIFMAIAAILLLNFFSCGKTSQGSGNSINIHNSKVSLDWAGIYTGVIPSAGGDGISVKVILNADETYTVEYLYIGKSDEIFTHSGTFTWNPDGTTIIMDNTSKGDSTSYYKLGENTLTHLDIEGNIITGEFADDYILRKQ